MNDPSDSLLSPVRVFLDANVLFAASLGGGSAQLWDIPELQLVTSVYAANEAFINLGNREDGLELQDELTKLLATTEVHTVADEAGLFTPYRLKDPNDVPILGGAIATHCQYLCTADATCFGEFYGTKLDGVEVIKPGKLLAKFQK